MKKASVVLLLAILTMSASFSAVQASSQAMAKPVLVIAGTGGRAGEISGYLVDLGYTGQVSVVNTQADLDTLWPQRDNYAIMMISYHGFMHNAFLQTWLANNGSEIVDWVNKGGSLLACTRDPQDGPLAALFGLGITLMQTRYDYCNLTSGTPFSVGIPDLRLNSINFVSEGFTSLSLTQTSQIGPMPSWVQYVVGTFLPPPYNATFPTIVAGKYGKGCLVLGAAKWNTADSPASYEPKNATSNFTPFFNNIFNWIQVTSEWVAPPDYYTRAEVDTMIAAAVNQAKAAAITEAVNQAKALIPKPTDLTIPNALGATGIVLGLIAIILALRRRS